MCVYVCVYTCVYAYVSMRVWMWYFFKKIINIYVILVFEMVKIIIVKVVIDASVGRFSLLIAVIIIIYQ